MTELFRDNGSPAPLPPQMIETWERRVGIHRSIIQPEPIRLSGPPEGMRHYGQHVEVHTDDPPDSFDSLMYVRQLSMIGTFCSLHTPPLQVSRNPRLIDEQPSEDLVIGVHTLEGRHIIRQGRATSRTGLVNWPSSATRRRISSGPSRSMTRPGW